MRALLGFGMVGVIAVVGFLFRDHLTGNVGDLRVGDCFEVPLELTEVSDIQHRPCPDPHTGEVFLVVDHPAAKDAPYPSEDDLTNDVFGMCDPAFIAYVDESRLTDELDYGFFFPLASGWKDGDREITCYATRVDSAPMTGSLKTP